MSNKSIDYTSILINLYYKGKVAIGKARYLLNIVF